MTNNHFSGEYFWRGLKLLWHPKLRAFVIIPLVLNILLLAGVFMVSTHFFSEFVQWLMHFLPHWLAWLSWFIWVVFVLSAIIIFAYSFTIITNIISAPFNGLLAERVQQLHGSHPPSADMSFAQVVAATPRNVGRAAKSLLYFLPRALLCFLLLFIPLAQTLVPIVWFLLSAWMMSVQYMDYPMDNNGVSFKEMLRELNQQKLASFSFGSVVLLGTMIPILNLVVMPAAVIGATLFWQEEFALRKNDR